ncbi:MAG TPA: F0F1 ATP synthase subunit B [Planctomycetota bacterium]|nr:F0F1 ATP synthase subunit B [Planctomycetota bacterium]
MREVARLLLGPVPLSSEGAGFNPADPSTWPNAVWTVVIFVAAAPLMWKFVFGPIVRALDARDERARKAVAEAQAARDEAKRAEAAVHARLAEASREVASILARGQAQAERQGKELLEKAEADARRSKERALAEIDAARARALGEIRGEVVDLSLLAASEVLRRNLDGADHRRLVEEVLEKAAPRSKR